MITINASEALTFPRSYIAGFAVFAEDMSASFEPPFIVVINEAADTVLRLKVNGEVYPARSRSYFLHEVFIAAESTYEVEGLPADLEMDVFIDRPDEDTDFCICVEITSMIETFTFIELPDMPTEYWRVAVP